MSEERTPANTTHTSPRFFRRLKIRHKLLLNYSALVLVVAILSNTAIYVLVRQTIQRNIENQLQSTIDAIGEMVNSSAQAAVRNRLRTIVGIAHDAANYFLEQARDGRLSAGEARSEAETVMLRLRIGESGYIYCLNSRGIIEVHPKEGLHQADLSSYGFILDQLQRKEGYLEYEWQNPDDAEIRPKALYMKYFEPWDWIISASSYRNEFNTLLDVEDFRDNILSLRFGDTGYPYVLDGAGNVVMHPNLTGNVFDIRDSNGRLFVQEICAKKNGTTSYTWQNPGEEGFREKLAVFKYLPEFDWIVVASSYRDEFSRPLDRVRNTVLATSLISLLLLIPITVIISSTITRPIERLSAKMQRGAEGDLSVRVTPESDDEVGRLARFFNGFMSRLEKGRTERQHMEAESERLAERLRQSEKMEAVGQLAGGVAHDFNNILAVVIGHADLLLSGDLSDEDRTCTEHIINAAERAAGLTRTLLDFSRTGALHSTDVDVHQLITEVVGLLEHSIDKRISIEILPEADWHIVRGDPGRLQNTFLNLALNARDAMPQGGSLSFSTRICTENDLQDVPLPETSEGYLKTTVRDSGTGMDSTTLDRAFEPFFTTKEAGKGTGMGLASAYGCIQGHGGTIIVQSEVDKGTSVGVYLPLTELSEQAHAPEAISPLPLYTGQVLVVDDEDEVRSFAEASLQRLGFSTTGCGDGIEAVEVFRERHQEISLVLLDLVMPRLNGPETLERLLEIDPQVVVVLCSGYTAGAGLGNELPAGAAGFLDKPYRLDDLSRIVGEVLSNREKRHS